MKRILLMLLPFIALSPAWAGEKIKIAEVVVSATKIEESVENVAQDVTIITSEEIERSGHSSVADTLKNVTGIQIREYGNRGASSSISVRGSSSAQVLILIDGKRLNKPGDGQFDLNTISVPLENIERIEVLRGASSTLYGADALGGVINIITKSPAGPLTKASIIYGSFDAWNTVLATSRKIGNAGYMFSASKEESSGFRENSDYETRGANGKLTFDLAGDFHVDLNVDYSKKEAGVPGPVAYPSPLARQQDENALLGVTFRFKDTVAKLYSHNSRIHYINPDYFVDSKHKNNVLGADVQSSVLIGPSNLVTGGIELIAESIDSTDIGPQSRQRKGIFIQDDISINEKLIFNLGIRYDDFEQGRQLTPRAAILYKMMKDTTIRFTAGKGYRIPSLNDLYWREDWGGGLGMFGNPGLRPEKSTEYEISIEQNINKKIMAKALVFQKDVRDLIKWQQKDDYGLLWKVENIDEARVRGFEFISRINMGLAELETSYFYQDPVNKNTGERIYDLSRHQVTGVLSVNPFKDTTWSIEGRYVSNYVKPDKPKWCYFVLDSKISKKFPLSFGEGEIFIKGKNLLDREYETSKGYPMPPVEFTGGISIKF